MILSVGWILALEQQLDQIYFAIASTGMFSDSLSVMIL